MYYQKFYELRNLLFQKDYSKVARSLVTEENMSFVQVMLVLQCQQYLLVKREQLVKFLEKNSAKKYDGEKKVFVLVLATKKNYLCFSPKMPAGYAITASFGRRP